MMGILLKFEGLGEEVKILKTASTATHSFLYTLVNLKVSWQFSWLLISCVFSTEPLSLLTLGNMEDWQLCGVYSKRLKVS